MKLNYRDRIILVVAMVVVILVGGFFALIRPMASKITTSEDQLKVEKQNWEETQKKLDRLPKLRERVDDKHKESLELANAFEEEKNDYEMDMFLQELCNKNELKLEAGLTVQNATVGNISFYYDVPSVLTYPLYEAADLNGTLSEARMELLKESQELQARLSESVVSNNVSFTCIGEKEGLMNFLKQVREMKSTVLVNSVTIDDYFFGAKLENTPENAEMIGKSRMTISLTSYAVEKPTDTTPKAEAAKETE